MFSLETMLGHLPDPQEWERQAAANLRDRTLLTGVGFLAVWEIQSYIATAVLIALVSFLSLWAALSVMLVWSLIAAVIYYVARGRGLPNPLEDEKADQFFNWQSRGLCPAPIMTLVKAQIAGTQAFVYSRTACRLLTRPAASLPHRVCRLSVVTVGLTLFGVTTADHILRRAGYSERQLLRLSLVGPFLNVPYRVLLSALVVETVLGLTAYVLGAGTAFVPVG